jgi:hypothetical protein
MHPAHFAATHPAKPAIVMAESGETVTYGELEAGANRAAQLFRSLGLKPGDHIAFMLENRARFFEICWAAQRSGLYFTAISTRLTAGEVDYIVRDSTAKVFITSTAMAATAEKASALMPAAVVRLMLDGTLPGFASYEAAVERHPAVPVADQISGQQMLYSSGTTGRPKGIKRAMTDEAFDAPPTGAALFQMLYKFDADTVYLSPAPLYHSAPLVHCMTVMRFGGTAVVMEHFDAEWALQLIREHRVTHSQWVPTMFVRMLKLPDAVRRKYDLSSHRVAIHAAAPCPIEVKRRMIEWWGPIICEYYAGTEGNGFCFITSEDWLAHPGSVGKALLGELHILDEAGEERPVGERPGVPLPQRPRQDRPGPERQGLVDPGRRRLHRSEWLPLSHRPQGLHDHLGRREHLSAGGGERADQSPQGGRRRGHRRAERRFRRGGEGGGAADRHGARRAGARQRTHRLLPGRARRREMPALGRLRAGAAAPSHRQALQAPDPRPLLGRPQIEARVSGRRLRRPRPCPFSPMQASSRQSPPIPYQFSPMDRQFPASFHQFQPILANSSQFERRFISLRY